MLLDGLGEYAWAATSELEPVPVDLGALAEDVADGLRPGVERAGGSVTIGELPTVTGDGARLRTVLGHLLRNAAMHAEREDVHIDVSAARDGDGWRITVADDGQGVAPEHREEVMRPFTRRGRSSTTDERTAGVGLAVSAAAVRRHGGRLWIDDAGPGAVVSFTLPDRSAG